MFVELKQDHQPEPYETLDPKSKTLIRIVLRDFAENITGKASNWKDFLSLVEQGAAILAIDPDNATCTLRSNIVGQDWEYSLQASSRH